MLQRVLSFGLFLIIVVVGIFNFKTILSFGRANQIEQSAKKAIQAQNWEKGIQLYEEGAKQFPENNNIATRLAWLYRKNGQPDKAEALYRNVLKREPGHQDARMGLANLLKNDPKRINEAITELRQALKEHPPDSRLLATIGNVYQTAAENPEEKREDVQKWLYGQARYYYEQSLKLNEKQFQPLFHLGIGYQNTGDNTAAAKSYCKALAVRPDSYEARYNLGLVLSDLNFEDEAYRQMERAIRILSDRNEMGQAQSLAIQVQNVKNRIFNSNRRTLGAHEAPPFLDKACLLPSLTESVASQGGNSH